MSSVRTHGSVVIHGHFYQPPREDPWLNRVPLQAGAAPYHDWNERVEAESYRPVVEARILNAEGEVRRVMNCLEHMSFNFGPTLLSWLEANRPATYEAILAADGVGVARTGHGGALAMAFHHPILPLTTRRDKRTEIRWGILDFRRRFGRDPEGMWLPETAVDDETLEVLAGEGIRFTIVAPHQLQALPEDGRPGLYRTSSGGTVTVFPYHGELSHGVAFGEALRDADRWADDLVEGMVAPLGRSPGESRAIEGDPSEGDSRGATEGVGRAPPRLCLVATDGETYGHHRIFGEMALAATLEKLDAMGDVALTNLSAYLADFPATDEVELVSPSSWSCAHGVGRWREDCGCRLDTLAPSTQAWRAPLRDAVFGLAEGLHEVFETVAKGVLPDPWGARDAYGEVAGLADSEAVRAWVEVWVADGSDQLDRGVQLLEMERNALRIFTSCAWFFDDLAGVEQVQVLRYAARALELVEAVGGPASALREAFLTALGRAESNDPDEGDGRRFYLAKVVPAVPATALVAARSVAGRAAAVAPAAGMSPATGPAQSTPWEVVSTPGKEPSLIVRHRTTGERVGYRFRSESTDGAIELEDDRGRRFFVDPGAPWP